MPEQQAQLETPAPANTDRLPFDVEFFQHSEAFCADVLKKVPELNGLAIIPLWANQPEQTPSGLLKLRTTEPPYLSGLFQLLGRLAAFGVDAHRDFVGQLQIYDRYATELSNKVKEHVEQLNALAPQSEPSPSTQHAEPPRNN